MSETDIRLDHVRAYVEAKDIVLVDRERMKKPPADDDKLDKEPNLRRALVHNPDDGLTINWHGDYPGDVRVDSNFTVDPNLFVKNVATATSVVTKRLVLTVPDEDDRPAKLVGFQHDLTPPKHTHAPAPGTPLGGTVGLSGIFDALNTLVDKTQVDVLGELRMIHIALNEIVERLKALESTP